MKFPEEREKKAQQALLNCCSNPFTRTEFRSQRQQKQKGNQLEEEHCFIP